MSVSKTNKQEISAAQKHATRRNRKRVPAEWAASGVRGHATYMWLPSSKQLPCTSTKRTRGHVSARRPSPTVRVPDASLWPESTPVRDQEDAERLLSDPARKISAQTQDSGIMQFGAWPPRAGCSCSLSWHDSRAKRERRRVGDAYLASLALGVMPRALLLITQRVTRASQRHCIQKQVLDDGTMFSRQAVQ